MNTFTIGWLNKCRCGNKSHTVKTARGNETALWDDDTVKCNSCGRGGVIQVCEGQARVLWETDEEMAEGKPMSGITKEQAKDLRNAFQCWQQDYDPAEDKEQYDMFGLGVVAMDALLASLEAVPVGEVALGEYDDCGCHPDARVVCIAADGQAGWENFKDGTRLFTTPPTSVVNAEPVSFDALRDAVAEVSGAPAMEWSDIYKGHQAVPFINFNSLARIVDKFRTAPPAPVSVPDNIDARMKNAGMLSATEIIAGQPIDAFMKHAGVVDLASLLKWAEMRRAEFLRMQAKYVLGDNPKDDMYEWVISHVAAFSELHVNIRAAMLQGAEPVSNRDELPDGWVACSERMPERDYVLAADFSGKQYPANLPNIQIGIYADWFDDGCPCWDDGDGNDLHLKRVTHWAQIPSAPQQEA